MSTEDLEEQKVDNLIGELVDGRFQILELLGEGGIGVVYKARHVLMDRFVAFKMLRSEFLDDQTASGRFQQEARAVCALNHPNIVSAFDFGFTTTGHAYLAMDLLEGVDLDSYLADKGPVPYDICFPLFLQICEALAHAHKVGIIHRDLKPSNIIVIGTADGSAPQQVKLVDFGMAKFTAGASVKSLKLTKPGDVFGSPYYMSPEQFQGPDLDERSDIYSLGCLMYEVVTGLPPHLGEDYLDVMRCHLAVLPEAQGPLAEDNAVSAGLRRIIFKMLEKSPDARYQKVDEILVDLKQLDAVRTGLGGEIQSEQTHEPADKPPQSAVDNDHASSAQNASSLSALAESPASKRSTGRSASRSIGVAIALLSVGAIIGFFVVAAPRNNNTPAWQELDRKAAAAATNGQYAAAEELYRTAVAEAEKKGEDDNPELSKSLASLGLVYHKSGKFDLAEKTLKRSIAVCQKQSDFDSSELSPLLVRLGEIYKRQGRLAEAEDIHRKVSTIIESSFARNSAE